MYHFYIPYNSHNSTHSYTSSLSSGDITIFNFQSDAPDNIFLFPLVNVTAGITLALTDRG